MHSPKEEEFEQDLQSAFEPDVETVDRLVITALRQRPRRSTMPRLAAAFAMVAIVAAALFLHFRPSTAPAESIRLDYIGDIARFEYADGSSWLVTCNPPGRSPSIHVNLIIIEGEQP